MNTITPMPTKPDAGKPRRWPWIAGIVAALVVGATIGAAGQTEPTATEPEVVTETVVETVTETVEVESDECREYAAWILEQFDAKDVIVLDAFGEMADILDRDGYMITSEYVTILNDATARMDDLTAEILAGPGHDCAI
jgi:hypothetical protein